MSIERVFAYGSNMHLADLRRWFRERNQPGGTIERVEPAALYGYELVWNYHSPSRDAGAANVERSGGEVVYGLVLTVDATALRGLDRKEGRGIRYDRALERVHVREGGHVEAWVYSVLPAYRQPRFVAPSSAYLSLVVDAAVEHAFPDAYVAMLRATPTRD